MHKYEKCWWKERTFYQIYPRSFQDSNADGIGAVSYTHLDVYKRQTYTPALIPSVDGRSISIVGGEDIVMTSTSSKKDAAWTFIQFLLQDEQQVAMAGAGMIPVTASAMEKVDTSNAPYVDVYMQQLKTAQARIPCSSWPTIETVLNTAFESVLRGDATSQEALDAAAAQIDELLAKE